MYFLQIHSRAVKQAKRLHPHDQKRLSESLNRLTKNPFSRFLDIKKLADTQASYRLRAGDFRVIYSLNTKKKIIYVWEVGYRGGVYR